MCLKCNQPDMSQEEWDKLLDKTPIHTPNERIDKLMKELETIEWPVQTETT